MRWIPIGAAAAALGAALCCPPAHAQRAQDTLRVIWRESMVGLDPYAAASRAAYVLGHEVFDTLVYRDPATFAIKPLLATDWRWEDDRTLLFTLRQGVLWQNGDPFTADDVAYTINLIASDPAMSAPALYDWLAGADALDATHVRVRLKRTVPAALDYFAMALWILPRDYRESAGADGFARAPVGTGPYRVATMDGAGNITLDRFDGYYEGGPKGPASIAHVVIRNAPDETSALAALLNGSADWTWRFNPARLGAIQRDPRLIGMQAESMRVAYLSLDASGRTGPGNPLTNVKVRQSIAAAIDRAALAHEIAGEGARPLVAPCFPAQFGCDAGAAVPVPYDPARARALLAEAGFPHGFKVQLTTYEPAQWSSALQSYLRAVGIEAEVIQLPRGEVVLRSIEGQTRMEAGDWGSYAINDVSAILPQFFTFTPEDYTRDPHLRDLLRDAGNTRDPARRKSDYDQAIHDITANSYWLPLTTMSVTYAFNKDLDFEPAADELPRFFLAHWNKPSARRP